MKKNNIKILVLIIVLMLTMVGCQSADKNLDRLSTQTRIGNRDMNDDFMGNDAPLNRRDGVNNLNSRNNDMNNNKFMDMDNDSLMNPRKNNNNNNTNNKLNNGMTRNNKMNNNNTNLSTDISNMSDRATTIAQSVMALPEINDASVLISGNTAIVGCDVNGDTGNKITNALKKKVEAAVKVADRNIQKVSITSDTNIFTRIQTMTKDMNNNNNNNNTMDGNPATKFTKGIEDILRDITNIR